MLNAHIEIRQSWPLIAGNPVPYLNNLRDWKNSTSAYAADRVARPRGKIAFGQFAAQSSVPAPTTVAVIVGGVVVESALGGREPVGQFLGRLPDGQYFCKPDRGGAGSGAMRLDVSHGTVMVGGQQRSLEFVGTLLSSQAYLVQSSLTPLQHREISRFNANSINTLRLITFDAATGPVVVCAQVRMARGAAVVDNWSAGGVVVPVDIDNAVLGQFGVIRNGLTIIDAHPQSGRPFRGQRIPYWNETVALVCDLHRKLAIKSVGWDVALLKDGPCVIELNNRWGVYMSSQLNAHFVETFLHFHLSRERERALQLELKGWFGERNTFRLWLCEAVGRLLASAKVEHFSRDGAVIAITGPTSSMASIAQVMRTSLVVNSPSLFRLDDIRVTPARDEPAPGLDINATFSERSRARPACSRGQAFTVAPRAAPLATSSAAPASLGTASVRSLLRQSSRAEAREVTFTYGNEVHPDAGGKNESFVCEVAG